MFLTSFCSSGDSWIDEQLSTSEQMTMHVNAILGVNIDLMWVEDLEAWDIFKLKPIKVLNLLFCNES